jgi:tetratricopeptide (TPR) repeat protein
MGMLNRAGQRSLLKPLRLESQKVIRSYLYHSFSHNPFARVSRRSIPQAPKPRPVDRRSLSTTQTPTDRFRNTVSKARKDHPFLLPALLIASFASLCYLALLSYDEYTREKPKLGAFPPAVERHLRNAIWYTEIKPEPSIALDSFTRAVERAEKEGLDPFSVEFVGIHIRLAAALEKFGRAKGAIEVLDQLVNDMVERIEDIDRGRGRERKVERTESNESGTQGPSAVAVVEASIEAPESERSRLLKKVIECKVKISQLYESDYIQDNASAKFVIDEAMKILIEAMRDPKSLQFDENRAGISADEAAAMLNQVGSSNLNWGDYGTALETFKLALIAVRKAAKGRPSCREALTLSNMHAAVSMMLESPNPVIDGKPATAASIKQAHQIKAGWAQQSLQCAQAVAPTEQDHLCAMAVIASWSGMASALMELGDLKGAKEMWEQVIQKSESEPALKQLLPNAHGALKEISEKQKR